MSGVPEGLPGSLPESIKRINNELAYHPGREIIAGVLSIQEIQIVMGDIKISNLLGENVGNLFATSLMKDKKGELDGREI